LWQATQLVTQLVTQAIFALGADDIPRFLAAIDRRRPDNAPLTRSKYLNRCMPLVGYENSG